MCGNTIIKSQGINNLKLRLDYIWGAKKTNMIKEEHIRGVNVLVIL